MELHLPRHHHRINDGPPTATRRPQTIQPVTRTGGGQVNDAVCIRVSERVGVVERVRSTWVVEAELVVQKPRRPHLRVFRIFAAQIHHRVLERPVGRCAVQPPKVAMPMVEPRVVHGIDGGKTHRDLLGQPTVRIEFNSPQVVAAADELRPDKVATKESPLRYLILKAADICLAVEERIRPPHNFHAIGAVGIDGPIPDPSIAHGVGISDAAKHQAHGAVHIRRIRTRFAGHRPARHVFDRVSRHVVHQLLIHDGNRIRDVLQLLDDAQPRRRLHRVIAGVGFLGDGEFRKLQHFLGRRGGRACRGLSQRDCRQADEHRQNGRRLQGKQEGIFHGSVGVGRLLRCSIGETASNRHLGSSVLRDFGKTESAPS